VDKNLITAKKRARKITVQIQSYRWLLSTYAVWSERLSGIQAWSPGQFCIL